MNLAKKTLNNKGFTILELLIALVASVIVIFCVYNTFASQHKSFLVQDQVSMAQQNLRASMDMLKREIQMAGYHTTFGTDRFTMDWNDVDNDDTITSGAENIRPWICAVDNINDGGGGDNILDNTDVLVIVKASQDDWDTLGPGETAVGTTLTLNGHDGTDGFDINGDGWEDLNDNTDPTDNIPQMNYGVLVKEDLSRSEFIMITNAGAANATITVGGPLSASPLIGTYGENDMIYRADVIIYKVDDAFNLLRRNLGDDNGYQAAAENVDNLQFRYQDRDGNWDDDPANFTNDTDDVRAVEISVVARTERNDPDYVDRKTYNVGGVALPPPNDNFRRKVLTCLAKTRNIGI